MNTSNNSNSPKSSWMAVAGSSGEAARANENKVLDETDLDENQIRNDFQDLLYLDELFPETEKFSTPIKELQRCAQNTGPVSDLTPPVDETDMSVLMTETYATWSSDDSSEPRVVINMKMKSNITF